MHLTWHIVAGGKYLRSYANWVCDSKKVSRKLIVEERENNYNNLVGAKRCFREMGRSEKEYDRPVRLYIIFKYPMT